MGHADERSKQSKESMLKKILQPEMISDYLFIRR
jgi:hypothetical protein